jgi:hypothetical protein
VQVDIKRWCRTKVAGRPKDESHVLRVYMSSASLSNTTSPVFRKGEVVGMVSFCWLRRLAFRSQSRGTTHAKTPYHMSAQRMLRGALRLAPKDKKAATRNTSAWRRSDQV